MIASSTACCAMPAYSARFQLDRDIGLGIVVSWRLVHRVLEQPSCID
jgi:hypothetical protein